MRCAIPVPMATRVYPSFVRLLLLVSMTCAIGAATHASFPTRNIHALLIFEGEVRKQVPQLEAERQLVRLLTAVRAEISTLQGPLHPLEVTNALDQFLIREGDTLFVFYAGPRNYQARTEREYLSLGHGSMWKQDLVTAAKKKKARFTVIATDTFDHWLRAAQAPPLEVNSLDSLRIVDNLFRESSGTIIMSAATRDESAWGIEKLGGLFTISLVQSLGGCRFADLDQAPRNGQVTWLELLMKTGHTTRHLYAKLKAHLRDTLPPLGPNQLILDELTAQLDQSPTALINLNPPPEPESKKDEEPPQPHFEFPFIADYTGLQEDADSEVISQIFESILAQNKSVNSAPEAFDVIDPVLGIRVSDHGGGAMIVGFTPDSWSERVGVRIGDVVIGLNHRKIERPSDLLFSQYTRADKNRSRFLVIRRKDRYYEYRLVPLR
jgi:hypothetical protein